MQWLRKIEGALCAFFEKNELRVRPICGRMNSAQALKDKYFSLLKRVDDEKNGRLHAEYAPAPHTLRIQKFETNSPETTRIDERHRFAIEAF